jgi:hypothetical protein
MESVLGLMIPCQMKTEVHDLAESVDCDQAGTNTKHWKHDMRNETNGVTVWTRSNLAYIDHEKSMSNSRSTHNPDAMSLPATNDHNPARALVAHITWLCLTKICP